MTPYLDIVDSRWRLPGYEHLSYSTRDDALEAKEFARQYALGSLNTESRYRRASERGAKRREAEGV